jgi:hypothetical protein
VSASFGVRDNNELSWTQVVDQVAAMSTTSRAWSTRRTSEAWRADQETRDHTVAGWNSRVLPSGSLHSICTRPPGCVFSTYLMPSRSSVAFIAS